MAVGAAFPHGSPHMMDVLKAYLHFEELHEVVLVSEWKQPEVSAMEVLQRSCWVFDLSLPRKRLVRTR